MKRFLKIIGVFILLLVVVIGTYYFVNNEALPEGKQGKKADALATKMLSALNHEGYKNTEVLEWSFRGKNNYKWFKQENLVEVSWENIKVILNTKEPKNSTVFVGDKKTENPALIKKATANFNNDSFWLVAPYKVFDEGTQRRIVKHHNKEALLITYTSGGNTPGDSYLWILDDNYLPTSYKMWTKIIPIGGVSASWSDLKTTASGIKLPTKHRLSLFGMQLDMGTVKAYNPKADLLANKILKAINHEAYKKTRFIAWSFAGKRFYKWDKKNHIVSISWDTIRVQLHPNQLAKSSVFFNEKLQRSSDDKILEKATKLFNNDSFWLVAPHKLFEDGIIRNLKSIDGKDALLITYTIGGSTPGDSYLWFLDKDFIPTSYKMYVPSMKMDGVSATWEDWLTTESGTLLPTNHYFGKDRKLSMGIVKAYN